MKATNQHDFNFANDKKLKLFAEQNFIPEEKRILDNFEVAWATTQIAIIGHKFEIQTYEIKTGIVL